MIIERFIIQWMIHRNILLLSLYFSSISFSGSPFSVISILILKVHLRNLKRYHRRNQKFYYPDFGWGTLIHFPASVNRSCTFFQFRGGKRTSPCFPTLAAPMGIYLLFPICCNIDSHFINWFCGRVENSCSDGAVF